MLMVRSLKHLHYGYPILISILVVYPIPYPVMNLLSIHVNNQVYHCLGRKIMLDFLFAILAYGYMHLYVLTHSISHPLLSSHNAAFLYPVFVGLLLLSMCHMWSIHHPHHLSHIIYHLLSQEYKDLTLNSNL